jgi:hypothetical protein
MKHILLYILYVILASIPTILAIQAYDKNKDYKNEHSKSYNYLKFHLYASLILLILLLAALYFNKK